MSSMLKVIKYPKSHETRIEMNIASIHCFTDEYLHHLVREYGKDCALDYVAETMIRYITDSVKNEVAGKAIDILI